MQKLQTLSNDSYALVDEVFAEFGMDSLTIDTGSSLLKHCPNGKVEYTQFVNKILEPVSFESTCTNTWKISKLCHRHIDREVYEDVVDSGNTVAYKFRLKKKLASGATGSIWKRALSRRFRERDREVFVWKYFSEGEGIFSGIDTEETGWVSVRPYSDGVKSGALMEVCSRQLPVPFVPVNANDFVVKAFKDMLQDAVKEDECELSNL